MKQIVIAGLLAILAQTALRADSEESVPDYAEGVRQFERMGLLKAQGEYVELSLYPISELLAMPGHMNYISLDGNAWKMEGASNRFISGGLMLDVLDRKDFTSRGISSPTNLFGVWRAADLDKDMTNTLEFIEKFGASTDQSFVRMRGPLLLFALHIYQLGLTNQANQMIHRLLSQAGEPSMILQDGVSTLANQFCAQALQRFHATRDWKALRDELDALQAQYAPAWNLAPGMTLLLQRVQERCQTNIFPRIAGLNEEQQRLADTLLDASAYHAGSQSSPFWLNDPLPISNVLARISGGDMQPVEAICSLGINAIPLLAALLDDSTLTTIPLRSLPNRTTVSTLNPSPEQQFQQDFPLRPATRAELAASLLQPLAETRGNHRALSHDALREDALAWLEEHRGLSPREIALQSLTDDGNSQRDQSLTWLVAQKPSDDEWALIETSLLESDQPLYSTISLASLYVNERGTNAAPFVQRLIPLLRERATPDEQQWSKRQIRDLQTQVSYHSLPDLLDDAATGRKTLAETSRPIQIALERVSTNEAFQQVLRAAALADSPEKTFALAGLLSRFSCLPAEMNSDLPRPVSPDAAAWRSVLERVKGNSEAEHVLAGIIEAIYTKPKGWNELDENSKRLAHLGYGELLLQRAQARLDGIPADQLPPLPDASDVPPERVNELLEKLDSEEEDAWPLLREITMPEYLALSARLEGDDARMERLAAHRHVVSRIVSLPEAEAELTPYQEKPPDAALLQTMRRLAEEKARQGTSVTATLELIHPLSGYSLRYCEGWADDPWIDYNEWLEEQMPETDSVLGQLTLQDGESFFAILPVTSPGQTDPAPPDESDEWSDELVDDDESPARFEEIFAEALANSNTLQQIVRAGFTSLPLRSQETEP